MDEERLLEIWSMLALQCSPLLSNASIKQLLAYYGTASNAIQVLTESMTAWSMLGISNAQIHSFTSQAWKEKAEHIWSKIQKYPNIHILLSSDKAYPPLLKEIADPPHILYYQGNIDILSQHGIAVIGTRKASSHGKKFAHSISTTLVEYGFSVISGLADGIDAVAHESVLSCHGHTIAVLGNGIDIIYPAKNNKLYSRIANEGCIISEFPPTTPPKAIHFPVRNRIVSGLSLGVVVVEAGVQSGTMLTVKNALEQGRSVYAIPSYHLTPASTGNSYLLEEGAIPITTAQDIFEDLLPQLLHLEKTPALFQKILDYQQNLIISQKDYFSNMIQIFAQSSVQGSTQKYDQYHPNPIPSPHTYSTITAPTLHYGEQLSHTPHKDIQPLSSVPRQAEHTLTPLLGEDIPLPQSTVQENLMHTQYSVAYKDSPTTPFSTDKDYIYDSTYIPPSTSSTHTIGNISYDDDERTYQRLLTNVMKENVAYGISSTGEKILTILHTINATPEDLVQRTAIDPKLINTELILLEVQGLIQKQAGGYYSILYE